MPRDEAYKYGECTVEVRKSRRYLMLSLTHFPNSHLQELLAVIERVNTPGRQKSSKKHPYAIVRDLMEKTYDYSQKQKYAKCYKWYWYHEEAFFKKIRRALDHAGYKDIEMKIQDVYLRLYIPHGYLEDGKLPLYSRYS